MKQWKSLIVFLLLCITVQALASWCTFQTVTTWYPLLNKPNWRPPNWLFAPVWTFLYLSMAVAAWRIWIRRGETNIKPALIAFFVQLFLNALWSVLFFSLNWLGAASIEIVFLWIAILATGVLFWRIDRVAGVLFVPYLIWVSFASALTFSIWRLNP
ncbi:MAG: TspO/MBR family protein [Candidatus Hinthialibacter antarcticus]|nr:TspO/MBR family protein [Candidatus Hinthialibacter antarcticus]